MSAPRSLRSPQTVLIAVAVLWGSTFAVTKDLLAGCPPLLYLCFRFSLGTLILWAGLRARQRTGARVPLRTTIILGGLTCGGILLQVLGQSYTTASKSAFLTALSVPLTPLCALLQRGDRPRPAQLFAVVLGAAGLGLLTYPAEGLRWNRGDLLTIACALLFAIYVVETTHRARGVDALRLAAAQVALVAGVSLALLVLVRLAPALLPAELVAQEARPLLLSGKMVLQGVYMGVVCTAITFAAQTWALARMSATESAVIFALEPVFATLMALLMLGVSEWPGARGLAGAALVLCAVLIAELPIRTRPPTAALDPPR